MTSGVLPFNIYLSCGCLLIYKTSSDGESRHFCKTDFDFAQNEAYDVLTITSHYFKPLSLNKLTIASVNYTGVMLFCASLIRKLPTIYHMLARTSDTFFIFERKPNKKKNLDEKITQTYIHMKGDSLWFYPPCPCLHPYSIH